MSFLIRNKTGGAIPLNDLGLTVPASSDFDLIPEDPRQVATSADLLAAIASGTIAVLDPLDGTTELTTGSTSSQSYEIVEVHNDPHYRIRGGTLNQLDDVNIDDVLGSPINLTNQVLQWNGSNAFEPTTPDDLIGDGSGAVQDIIASTLVDGVNTTVTFDGSPFTTIQVDVDDVFLMNTGDTLDSGTLTIAEGATLLISGDGGSGGATLTIGQDATATITTPTGNFSSPNQIVNKEYVDSIAGGLDWKESVRAASTGDVGGSFTLGSPVGPGDALTGGAGTLDGVTLEVGDRVLFKDQTDATQNGIWVVTGLSGSPQTADYERAPDQNGDPTAEVSGGNATFVEEGDTYADSGWVVTGNGVLTLGTDDIDWTQFAGTGSITGDVGIAQTGTVLALDLSVGEVTAATPALADRIAFHDVNGSAQSPTGTQTYGATFSDTFNALDVVYGISSNGIIVRTADDTYASRTIVAAGLGDRDGLEVLNGDGVSGNPTIGLDIENLPYYSTGSPNGSLQTTGRVAVYDPIADVNVYYNVSDIAGALASTNSFETWQATGTSDTGGPIVADSSTDTATLIGGTGISLALAAGSDSITFNLNFAQVPAIGSPLTIDSSDEIIINDGGTIVTTTLGDLITELGLDTDELVKVSSNDTTPGYLDGKLVAGTYTTLTQNNDGGNETLTVDIDPSTITLGDLGDVILGSPTPQEGYVLTWNGSPGSWTAQPPTSEFNICTLTAGDLGNLDLTDTIAVCDGANTVSYSFQDILNELDVPSGITGTGVVVKIEGSPDTYATRDIVESTNEDLLGANVVNGDGVSGDIEVGVTIDTLTDPGDDLDATDEFIIHDKSEGTGGANRKITGQNVADGVVNILNLGGLSVQQIGGSGSPGQFTLFLTDDERGKDLSVAEFSLTWSEGSISNNDWIEIGNAVDADISFIVPMNATIVRATAFSVSAGSSKGIDLYIDTTPSGTLVTIPSGTNAEVSDVTLNIDVSAGQRLRLRGASTGGTIQDATIVVWLKWRA